MIDQSGSTYLLEYAAGTTTGARREVNEDAFGIFPERHVFVVVDGCGSASSGASVAQLAVERFAELPQRDPVFARDVGLVGADPLALAVLRANIDILREGQTNAELRGQGATLCAVRAAAKMMSIVHVGDCRVGCYREGRLAWLTEDHSVVAELRRCGSPEEEIARVGQTHSTVITRAVGVTEQVAVDLSYHPAAPGDLYLLCTDGLTRHVDHARISELVGNAERSLRERCTALLDASEAAGGHDNTTIVLVRLRSAS